MKKVCGIALSVVLLFGIMAPAALADSEPEPVAMETEIEQGDDTYVIEDTDGEEAAALSSSEAEGAELAAAPEVSEDEYTAEDEYASETTESGDASELSEEEETAEEPDDEEPDEEEPFDPYSVEVGPENDPDDPLYARMQSEQESQDSQVSAISLFSTSVYDRFTTRALVGNETLHKGIDVSNWQEDIDWEAVAADGVEFVFIRAAYRTTSSGELFSDSRYAANIKGAQAAGLKVGVYVFSQAITVEEAQEEAQLVMALVKDYSLDLPLVIDYEYPGSYGRLYNAGLSQREGTDICLAFCTAVESAGYDSMVYASCDMLQNHLYADEFSRVWLAHYTTQTTYPGSYEYWQCTSAGSISGISGKVDLDFWFDPSGTPAAVEDSTDTATQDTSTQDTAAQDTATQDTATQDTATQDTVTQDTAAQDTAAQDTATQDTATQDTAAQDTAAQDTATPETTTNPFTDVSESSWFYETVMQAYSAGIVTGMSDTTFSPNSTATRGQVITMIYRMAGSPAVSGTTSFMDLTADWYKDAVTWASQNQVVSGYSDTQFGPGGNITRAELATMLYRLSGSPAVSGDLSAYTDAESVQSWAQNAMAWAVEKGIVNGYEDKTLRPNTSATRAEVCTMLMRYKAL